MKNNRRLLIKEAREALRAIALPPDFAPPKHRTPKGYIRWDGLAPLIQLFGAGAMAGAHPHDFQMQALGDLALLWLAQSGPVYSLDSSLCSAFKESSVGDSPEFLLDLRVPAPTLLLLFPQNSIPNALGHGFIDWAIVSFWDPDHPEYSSSPKWGGAPSIDWLPSKFADKSKYKMMIFWAGMDSAGGLFCSSRGIRRDGNFKPSIVRPGFENEESRVYQLREIVLQSLMAISFRPDLIEEAPTPRTRKGFGKGGDGILAPRWIGRGYQIKRSGGEAPPPESSRQWHIGSFWRRGHWRSQPYGKGRKLRRWQWIEPVLVTPK